MMLYRLHPPADVDWAEMPGPRLEDLPEHGGDLDRLEWKRTEDRQFSQDLLRIALRHGVPSRHGLVVEASYATNLGRAGQLRLGQRAIAHNAEIRAQSGERMEQLSPDTTGQGEELDARIRESSERVARAAEEDLATVLAAPGDPALDEHWVQLGGTLPD